VLGLALPASAAVVALSSVAADASAGTVVITPNGAGAAAGPFTDGEPVTVAVGPNSTFRPGSRVNIIECADPGGSAANLPRDNQPCDGLTIQGDTVLAGRDGSLSDRSYTIYRLPSPSLGEQLNAVPVCDQTHACVLYVGQDQDTFSAPKLFSAPFTVVGSGAAPSAAHVGGPATDPASLAHTGVGSRVSVTALCGFLLVLVGSAGRLGLRGARP
jgi:hypothetical protein